MNIKLTFSIVGASVVAFLNPVFNYAWLCTAMVAADFISARMLARRIRRRYGTIGNREKIKFSSRRFGHLLATLGKIYTLLLLAHGVDSIILGEDTSLSLMRFASTLVCFWQFWSILENESSANNATWARLAQKILIDKTERHLGVDLSILKNQ